MKLFFDFHKKDGTDRYGSITEFIVAIAATLVGLYFSYELSCNIIGFKKLAIIFRECFYNVHAADQVFYLFCIWFFISLPITIVAIVNPCTRFCKSKKNIVQCLFTFMRTSMLVQVVLPLISAPFFIAISSLFLCYYLSKLFGLIVEYLIGPFLKLFQELCTFFGISIICNGLSMSSSQCVSLLKCIAFFISIPYIIPFVLSLTKQILYRSTKSDIINYIFKPAEFFINTETLRYLMYIMLFFISVISYDTNIQSTGNVLPLFKEALLEFVVLDTIIYSIVTGIKNKRRSTAREKAHKYCISFKYDLEFIISAIALYNLNEKEMSASIRFRSDVNTIKGRNLKEIKAILTEISTKPCKMDELELKAKRALNMIINLGV